MSPMGLAVTFAEPAGLGEAKAGFSALSAGPAVYAAGWRGMAIARQFSWRMTHTTLPMTWTFSAG